MACRWRAEQSAAFHRNWTNTRVHTVKSQAGVCSYPAPIVCYDLPEATSADEVPFSEYQPPRHDSFFFLRVDVTLAITTMTINRLLIGEIQLHSG